MTARDNGMQLAPGKPIPTPKDFPVRWENPEDGRLHWTYDGYHFPAPVAPLEYELVAAIYEDGVNGALADFDIPFRLKPARINTYFYRAGFPLDAPPDGVARLMNQARRFAPGLVGAIESKAVAGMTKKYLDKLSPVVFNLESYWDDTLLPEIKGYLAEWEAFDVEIAPMPDLLAHLERVLTQAQRIGILHFLVHIPNVFAMSQFDELFRDLFGSEDNGFGGAFAAYGLLQGFDNMVLVGDRSLWELGRKALTMPAVQKILEEQAPVDVVPALARSAVGQVFLEELQAFLREHGQRGAMFSAIREVSWIEDPTPVIKMLQDYITQPDRDLEAELAAEAEARQRLVLKARRLLEGYPQPVVDEFERLLKAAQTAAVLHSDHGYWIDYRAMYNLRRLLLEFGGRLAAGGAIDAPEDVLFLWLDELKAAAKDTDRARKQDVVAARKAEMAHFSDIKPPTVLGTVPLMPPPTDEPILRGMMKTTGETPIPTNGEKPDVLRGHAGSPGTVRGPAKVVRTLAEAAKLKLGDILVAESTAPPWTPLFVTATAVVTDMGGVLSHGAVVAREYRIPAVVGTGNATETLQDGQMIEVDGNAGTVRIV